MYEQICAVTVPSCSGSALASGGKTRKQLRCSRAVCWQNCLRDVSDQQLIGGRVTFGLSRRVSLSTVPVWRCFVVPWEWPDQIRPKFRQLTRPTAGPHKSLIFRLLFLHGQNINRTNPIWARNFTWLLNYAICLGNSRRQPVTVDFRFLLLANRIFVAGPSQWN